MSELSTSKAPEKKFTLEQRLFHEIHRNEIHQPSVKEFKEAMAFLNATKSTFGRNAFDIVIDVAGGHGALAALFLIFTSASKAVVIDPAKVGNDSVRRAWKAYIGDKNLSYRHEVLQTGLPAELDAAIYKKDTNPNRVLVVGCHACQHLSEEIISISRNYNVHIAVLPCCQKDPLPGSPWKFIAKKAELPFALTMDILLAGKAMSNDRKYDVRVKFVDSSITPQNRLILCKRVEGTVSTEDADRKLELAYAKAHINSSSNDHSPSNEANVWSMSIAFFFGGIGFGLLFPLLMKRVSRR